MVDMGAFREAVANALIHRDYHRLGAVHIRLEDDALVVSNPGGLVDGVTLSNLLVTEPRPRNRALADAMKRIGVVERSGRGVDTIYRGMLKFGRSAPDYRRTDAQNVVLRMPTEPADLEFRRMVVDEERRRISLSMRAAAEDEGFEIEITGAPEPVEGEEEVEGTDDDTEVAVVEEAAAD
jgi:ATP-dependent DNA helicase RecG